MRPLETPTEPRLAAIPLIALAIASALALLQTALLVLGDDAPAGLDGISAALGLVLLLLLPMVGWWLSSRLRPAGAAQEKALRDLLGAGTEACLWWWEPAQDRAWFSARWIEVLGFTPTSHEALASVAARIHPADRGIFDSEFQRLLEGWTDTIEHDCRLIAQPDRVRRVRVRAVASRAPDGSVRRVAGSVLDVTEQHDARSELTHGAYHDPLTGLPNRALFVDRLGHALARARRDSAARFAVLHLDVDRFAVINDVMGHRQGDLLLVVIARRLEAAVGPGVTLARHGGDEFTVLLDPVSDGLAEAMAARLQDAVAEPLHVEGRELRLTATVGIAVSNPRYTRPDELIRDADIAKNSAKARGGAAPQLFDSHMHRSMADALHLEADLRSALGAGELEVHYQPIVEADDGRLCGFEALVRWSHADRGWVSPAEFVPLAEQAGLIDALGLFVLDQVCRTIATWPDDDLRISVNLSPVQLRSPSLVEDVAEILAKTGVNPRRLRFELTETAVVDDEERSLAVLQALRALGIKLCIDDFGTGYSSLLHLHRFPIDVLKIDREFVRQLDPKQPGIVRTIIDLARSLGMATVAEGVEEPEQRDALGALGCDALQGFMFSRAVPAEQALRMVEHGPPWPLDHARRASGD